MSSVLRSIPDRLLPPSTKIKGRSAKYHNGYFLPAVGITNRFIIPFCPVLVQVFQSFFDDWTKKLHTTPDVPRDVCKETGSLSVWALETVPKTEKGID